MKTIAIATLTLLAALLGAPQAPATTPTSVAGEWTIYLGLRQPAMFRGSLAQEGAKLAGVMGNETAEYPVKGSVEGTQMKLVWTVYEAGEKVDITVTAKFEREAITGTATIGDIEEVEVTGQRTSKG